MTHCGPECGYCRRVCFGFGGLCQSCNWRVCIVHRHEAGICQSCNTARGVAAILEIPPVVSRVCSGTCRRISCDLGHICNRPCTKAEGHAGNCFCNPERALPDIKADDWPDSESDDPSPPFPKRRKVWNGALLLETARASEKAGSKKSELQSAPAADVQAGRNRGLYSLLCPEQLTASNYADQGLQGLNEAAGVYRFTGDRGEDYAGPLQLGDDKFPWTPASQDCIDRQYRVYPSHESHQKVRGGVIERRG